VFALGRRLAPSPFKIGSRDSGLSEISHTHDQESASRQQKQKCLSKKQKESISLAGNRTPASCELFFRMTSRNTDHYTTKDDCSDGEKMTTYKNKLRRLLGRLSRRMYIVANMSQSNSSRITSRSNEQIPKRFSAKLILCPWPAPEYTHGPYLYSITLYPTVSLTSAHIVYTITSTQSLIVDPRESRKIRALDTHTISLSTPMRPPARSHRLLFFVL
jgi:hypothetical protein